MKKNIFVAFIILMLALSNISCAINNEDLNKQLHQNINSEIMSIHFLDVGQADCTFIELSNGEKVLIDTGNSDDKYIIEEYLKKLNINDIEYLILTHPHEDHIGSAQSIIENFNIEKIYMPDLNVDNKIYEDLLSEIKQKNIPVIKAKAGTIIIDSDEIDFKIIAPKSMYYSEINEYSLVSKLDYKNTSFLFTGDAESVSELEMVRDGYNLDCNLLKIGHHGGRTSSSKIFLQNTTPQYSVISSGEGNIYSHPHDEVISRLSSVGSDIYRTDLQGTIIASSDGDNISMRTLKSSNSDISNNLSKNDKSEKSKYIGNKNTHVFHLQDCSSIENIKKTNIVLFTQKNQAVTQKYKPCAICCP